MKYFSKWEPVKHIVPQGWIVGALLSLLYINDLPKIISDVSKPTVFADDTSIVVTYSDPSEFKNYINYTFTKMNNWLKSNLLSLNFDKSNFYNS
jgi:beta-lactam-binding protein with PASTA domain